MAPLCVRASVVVNEIYYDHPGADAGYEYVELMNASSDTVSLANTTLEFHNGSGEGWTVLWQGSAADVIVPGELFVIGAAKVSPIPDAVISLSLQNGPDAIRIVLDSVPVDVVGYGGLDDPVFVEQLGAASVVAGHSIGRMPDGEDSNNNAADFVALLPSPGSFNLARHDVALTLEADVPTRSAVPSAGVETIRILLRNLGTNPVAAGDASVSLVDSTQLGARIVGTRYNERRVEPGASEPISFDVVLREGYHWLIASTSYAPDERSHNNEIILVRRAGSVGLLVSEVLSYPAGGCPQFVELYNASAGVISITGFSIRDRTHVPVTITSDPVEVAPREFVVVTHDIDALQLCVPAANASDNVAVEGTWPTFNRSGSGDADSVIVLDQHGIVVDAVVYPGLSSAQLGKSLERVNLYVGGRAVFLVSLHPSGSSPGRAGKRAIFSPVEGGGLTAEPKAFFPRTGGTLQISVEATADVTMAMVSVFDMKGIEVATPGSTSVFPAVIVWDGRTEGGQICDPGFYIVACQFFGTDGGRHHVSKVIVASVVRNNG